MNRLTTFALAVAAVVTAACGGSTPDASAGSTPTGQTVVVATVPAETSVEPGKSVRFTAQVTGSADTSVRWSVDEAGGGTIDANGLYTAPATEGTFHVSAEHVSQTTGGVASAPTSASKNGNGKSVVHVSKAAAAQGVFVTVTPGTATVPTGGSANFAAAVTGTANLAVTWAIQEGSSCGSVTSGGVYTAPNAEATCHVVATSSADTTKSASATVAVTNAPVVAVSVSPATASLTAGGTRTFTATVSGTTAGQSTAVTWSVPAGAGSIGATTGVYVAPATPGTYVVTATSVADGTKKATATVTVTASVVTIAISPTTATLDACRGQVFTASVANSSNVAVTWTVTEAGGGTVANGAYFAPTTAGTYHVVATSQADPAKTAVATVTVGPERVLSVTVAPGSGTVNANGTIAFAANVTTTCGTFAAN
jgi:hypothetical protein